MLKALYYPHTQITSPLIIKNALLLWDSIETIVPHKNWRPLKVAEKGLFNEAIDLVVSPRVPTKAERQEAHVALSRLLSRGLPATLLKEVPPNWRAPEYLIYPEKFLNQTWRLLELHGVASWVSAAYDYGVPPAFGFLMMSILADSCAGTQIQKVTDRVDAYAWLAEHHARLLGSQYITGLDPSQVAPSYDRLVTLSLTALNARDIPLSKLVRLRKRELRTGGTAYSAMRRRYATALRAHLKRIGTDARSATDVAELERQFRNEVKDDLADLKTELGLASLKALFSKEVALSAVILAGCLTSPITGLTALTSNIGLIGVIPLLKAAVDYRGARRTAFQHHSMSWLFLATQRRLSLR
jgi:hypothetical protein